MKRSIKLKKLTVSLKEVYNETYIKLLEKSLKKDKNFKKVKDILKNIKKDIRYHFKTNKWDLRYSLYLEDVYTKLLNQQLVSFISYSLLVDKKYTFKIKNGEFYLTKRK